MVARTSCNKSTHSLEELLTLYSPVRERVNGVHHQVGFTVVFKLKAVTVATWPDGLHNDFGTRDLVLNVSLQDTEEKKNTKLTHTIYYNHLCSGWYSFARFM